jgi:nitrogenase-stabilizing/protective protein
MSETQRERVMASPNLLAALNAASSAEEVFALLSVAFDPKVMDVARLHILKRLGDYLAREALDGEPAEIVFARCKAALERAYADFVNSSPLQERVFKVLRQAAEPADPDEPEPFVPLDMLTK